jgi:hypothetical protein
MPNLDDSLQNDSGNATAVANNDDSAQTLKELHSQKSFEKMRSSPSKEYHCCQPIAPLYGDIPPEADDYFKVECHDISQGGISFFLKRPAGCEKFAIVLGQKPMITTLIGRVVYSKEVEHKDERMYLVGCQFIGRLQE